MERAESSVVEERNEVYASMARGGPIYVSDMVGPLTRVSDFETSLLDQIEALKIEIGDEICCDEDLSVDELKILTEEELADKAFQVAFNDSEEVMENLENESCSNGSSKESADNGKLSKGVSRKRKKTKNKYKKRPPRKEVVLGDYVKGKVEELARVKQKQDEDKEAARLHSFDGSSRSSELVVSKKQKRDSVSCLKSTSYSCKVKLSNDLEPIPIRYPEFLLCIEVYHSKRTWMKTQELMVLGRQTLDELKDKIHCSTDEIMRKAELDDHSGYFLIEDTFYNDLRDPSAIDYSKPIFSWLKGSKKEALQKWECINSGELQPKQKELLGSEKVTKLPQFKAVQMQKTKFRDLRFRLGAGYLYCHQGDCKHAIVIRDMRLINPEDLQSQTAYPVVTFQIKPRMQKCSVCKIYGAEKVTVDDKWAEPNPCYFCGLCYYMLHYDDGSLLYNEFSVYDYIHD